MVARACLNKFGTSGFGTLWEVRNGCNLSYESNMYLGDKHLSLKNGVILLFNFLLWLFVLFDNTA